MATPCSLGRLLKYEKTDRIGLGEFGIKIMEVG